MASVVISEVARLDIVDIENAVFATNGEFVAARIVRELGTAISRLEIFPSSGRTEPKLRDDALRVLVFQRWLVIYEWDRGAVSILRVVDGARDLSRIDLFPA